MQLLRTVPGRLFGPTVRSAVGMIWRSSPGRSLALLALILWSAASYPLSAIAMGALVNAIPAAIRVGAAAEERGASGAFLAGLGQMAWPLAAVSALYLAAEVVWPVASYVRSSLAWRVDRHVSLRLAGAALRPEGIAHLEDPKMADRLALATGSLTGANPGRAVTLLYTVGNKRLGGIFSTALLFTFHWWAPLVVLGGVLLIRVWLSRESASFASGMEASTPALRRGTYFRDLALAPEAAKELRVFGLLDWAMQRFMAVSLEGMRVVWRERAENRLFMLAAAVAFPLSMLVVVWMAVQEALAGQITLGALVMFIEAVNGMEQLADMPDVELEFRRAALAFPQVGDLDRSLPAESTGTTRLPEEAPRETIRFENVAFHYPGQDRPVYRDLDLDIPVGRSLAIVGKNGAGKTTLIKLLARLYNPQGGRITVDGTDLRAIAPEDWRRRVAVIFQDFTHWELPARDNVGFGAPAHLANDDFLFRALDRAQAGDLVRGLPGGLDTILSRRFTGGTDLSGGQWQRIAMARAMAAVEGGARVLVLDEPTAALDVRAEAEFYNRFLDITRGLTTILIPHRFSSVRLADRIVVIEEGRLVEDGSHGELMAQDGRYAAMFRLQAERFQEGEAADD